MSDSFRAGKYHATAGIPSMLNTKTPHTFAWFDYLEGQRAGFNELYWREMRFDGIASKAEAYLAQRDACVAQLKAAGRR